jgi:hypothetical protein
MRSPFVVGQFDCHPEQAFLRREGSGRAARCVALVLSERKRPKDLRHNNRVFGSLPYQLTTSTILLRRHPTKIGLD